MGLFAFDTHKAVKQLKGAGFSDDQAEAVTTLFWDTRALELENLASREDLESLRSEMVTKDDLGTMEVRLREEMGAVEVRLREEMGTMEVRLREEMGTVEGRLREEMGTVEGRLRKDMATKEDLANMKVDLIKWLVPLVLTQTLATVGLTVGLLKILG